MQGRTLASYAWCAFAAAVALGACSGGDGGVAEDNRVTSGGASGSSGSAAQDSGVGATAGGGEGGGGIVLDSGDKPDGLGDAACAQSSAEATLEKKPVDVIFIIDNSGSTAQENSAVRTNLNTNFATIIEASGVDYRVIMLTGHSEGTYTVRIDPPLSGGTGGTPVNNPPKFYHYDKFVRSHDSLCLFLTHYDTPDKNGFSGGLRDWLRPEAVKVFVEITDDGINCDYGGQTFDDNDNVVDGESTAMQFDTTVLARDPAQFGTAAERNYVWYSIVAMQANTPPTAPWLPTDPVITAECATAAGPGTGYQALSNLTGGLKFPVCEGMGFDAVFQAIAAGVVSGAKIACEFEIPMPTNGQTIDPATVEVSYTSGAGAKSKFNQVADAASCAPNSFYIDAGFIKLCPDTCTIVEGDSMAQVDVLYGCEIQGPN